MGEEQHTRVAMAARLDLYGHVRDLVVVLTREQVLALVSGGALVFGPSDRTPIRVALMFRETDEEAGNLISEFLAQQLTAKRQGPKNKKHKRKG